jgi:putative ABC transport system permease protein
MSSWIQDLLHAVRSLRRRPGFAVAALVSIAVGISANVSVFSLVNALLLRPLPFGDRSDRVVTIHSTHRLQPEDWEEARVSYPDFLDIRARSQSFEYVGGMLARNFTVTTETDAERLLGLSVTPGLFAALGVEPMLGRDFRTEEGAPPGLETSVILTHGLWQRRYGGDPGIIGRAVQVNERARTVVGVMPPRFKFPHRAELYMPLRWDELPRSARNLSAVAILRRGVSIERAQADLDAIAARLAASYPETNRGFALRVMSFRNSNISGGAHVVSAVLMAAVAFVLLIVCANLTSLLLVHGAARQREMAVRAALGASRRRLLWTILSESAILATVGAALGVLGTVWALDWMRMSVPEELPYWFEIAIDVRIVTFTVAITVLTALAVGLLPAVRASARRVIDTLKEGGRFSSLGRAGQRTQSALAVVQVALCLALLMGANLMIRSFLARQSADLGVDQAPLLTARAYLAGDAYDDVRARGAFFSQAVETLNGLPGVAASAATTSIPGDDGGSSVRLVVDGQGSAEDDLAGSSIGVTADIFAALGVKLLHGRPFSSEEVMNPDARVAIVNARLARRLWPDGSVLDRRIGFRGERDISWVRIVGVAPDIHYEEVGEQTDGSRLNVYLPYASSASRTMSFLLRANGSPEMLIQPVRDTLRRLHAGFPLFEIMPMSDRRRFTTWEERFYGQLMGSFAAVALLLAAVGTYALLSYATRRRTQEIGVRLALGASPSDVVRLFLRQGSVIAAAGLTGGLVLAAAVARALSGTLFGVEPFELTSIAMLGGALLGVVLLATYWPARRAARIDPMSALRVE